MKQNQSRSFNSNNVKLDIEPKISLFKPIVATSLALALGVSVAVADACPSGSTPSICYGTTSATTAFTPTDSTSSLNWNSSVSNVYSPIVNATNDKSQIFVNNLTLKFTTNDPALGIDAKTSTNYKNYTISLGVGPNKNVSNNDLDAPLVTATNTTSTLKLDAGGQAIKLGEFGNGTITLDFGDFTSTGLRTIEMNFNGSASDLGSVITPRSKDDALSGNYSLVGNIDIFSGDEATYNMAFSNSMRGDITIYTNSFRTWDKYISGTKGSITFSDNANLEGNLTSAVNSAGYYDTNTTKGGLSVTFGADTNSTNTVTGNIAFVNGTNTIEFKGNAIIGGALKTSGAGYVEGSVPNADGTSHYVPINAQNTITIGGNANIGQIITSGGSSNITIGGTLTTNGIQLSGGSNSLTINNSTDTSTIGYIENSGGNTNRIFAQKLTFIGDHITNNASSNIFKTSEEGTEAMTFNAENLVLSVSGGGTALNSIETTGALTLSIKGMKNTGNDWSTNKNIITGGNDSRITVGEGGMNISHGFYNQESKNHITVGENSLITLNGDITSTAKGKNIFTLGNESTLNGKNVKIIAKDGWSSQNTIESTGSITISLLGMEVNGNGNSTNTNTITGGDGSQLTIGSKGLFAHWGRNLGNENIITLGENSTLTFNAQSIDNGQGGDKATAAISTRAAKNTITVGSLVIQQDAQSENGSTEGSEDNSALENTRTGNSTQSVTGMGIYTEDRGINTLSANTITIDTTSYGMYASGSGKNIINLGTETSVISGVVFTTSNDAKSSNIIQSTGAINLTIGGLRTDGNGNSTNTNTITGGDGSQLTIGSKGLFAHWGRNLGNENIITLGENSTLTFNAQSIDNGQGGDKATAAISTRAAKNTITVDSLVIQQDQSNAAINGMGLYTEDRGINTLNVNSATINTTKYAVYSYTGNNIINAENLTITTTGNQAAIYARSGGQVNIDAQAITLTSSNRGIYADSTSIVNINSTGDLTITGGGNQNAIYTKENGRVNIVGKNITLKTNSDVVKTDGSSIINITAQNLTITRTSGSNAVWGNESSSKINFTILDNGVMSVINSGSLQNIVTNNTINFDFLGSGTLKAKMDQGSGTNNFNLGSQDGVDNESETITLQVGNLGSGTKNINFNQDNRTLAFKNSSGSYADYAYSAKFNLNFNANNGVFDLNTNNLAATGGTVNINLNQEESSNTVKAANITTNAANTNINFNTNNTTFNVGESGAGTLQTTGSATTAINLNQSDSTNTLNATNITTSDGYTKVNFTQANTQLNLKSDGSGVLTTIGGNTQVNFAEGIVGILNGGITTNTSGTTTINVADGAMGTILKNITTSSGSANTNIIYNPQSNQEAIQEGGVLALEGANNTISTITATGTIGALISSSNTTNTISTLSLDTAGKMVFYGGNSTISTISVDVLSADDTLPPEVSARTLPQGGILELTTKTDAINTNITASGTDEDLNVLFTGGTDGYVYRSTLTLTGENNRLASVTSQAKNAFIKLDGSSSTASVDISSAIEVTDGNSLVFSLVSGTSGNNATATVEGGITVRGGGVFGVSIGAGEGSKSISIQNTANRTNNSIVLDEGATLLVEFQNGAKGEVDLGSNAGNIETGRKSIINFLGNNAGASITGGITIAGGTNTVNFLGNATLSGINFNSGINNINVKDNGTTTGVTATINLADNNSESQLGNMTNTINLENNATLVVNGADGQTGSILSSGLGNTLNFIGDNTKLQGGFGVNDSFRATGSATINVGYVNTPNHSLQGVTISEEVSGTITGEVKNADLAFNAKKSQLTLQGANNTFKSLTSNATDGLLYLNAQTTDVSAEIQGDITIGEGTSLTFGLISGNLPSSNNQASGGSTQDGVSTQAQASATGGQATLTTSGNIVVKGTLGIAIGGDGTNTRSVTLSEGKNITFDPYSKLRVDFLEGSRGQATLGSANNKFKIEENRESEINFYANSNATLAGGGLSLQGGTNTVNFYGDATLGQIELLSGINNINVKDSITAKIENTGTPTLRIDNQTSNINNVSNTINLGEGSTLKLNANTADNGDGSILSALKNELNFNGNGSTLEGGFGATEGGSASIKVDGTNSTITGDVTNSSITFATSNADLTLQGANNTITTLAGYTPAVVSYVRNGRVISTSSQNTLTLDATTDIGASVTIAQAITGNSVALKFGNGNNSKTFTLSEGGNTLSGVLFGSSSTNNTLAFTKGANAITDEMSIATNNGLTIALKNGSSATPTSLNFAGGFNKSGGGTANLSVEGIANISGEAIDINSLAFGTQNSSLAIQNAQATFGELNSTDSATLTLDGSNNEVNTTITALKTDKLTASFIGENGTVLTISGGNDSNKEITLADINVDNGSTNNILDLSSLTKTTITNGVNVAGSEDARKELVINLADTELNLIGGLNTQNATTTINVNEATTGATLSGGNVVVTNLNMSGTGALQTTFKNSSTTIGNLSALGDTSNKIILDGSSSTNGVTTTLNTIKNGENLDAELKGDSSKIATLNLNGGILKSVTVSNGTAGQNILSLQSGKLTIVDAIDSTSVATSKGLTLEFSGSSELVTNEIDNTSGGTININLKNIQQTAEGGEAITLLTQGIISGGDINISNLSFEKDSSLLVRTANATFSNASGEGVLSLDGANTTTGVKVTLGSTQDITANFNGTSKKGNELVLNENTTLKNITFSNNSVNNKITLTSSKTFTVSDQVIVGSGSEIIFAMANNSTLEFSKGMISEDLGQKWKNPTTLNIDASNSANIATLKGGVTVDEEGISTGIQINTVNLIADDAGSNNSQLTIKASNTTINTLYTKLSSGDSTTKDNNNIQTKLALDSTDNAVSTTINAVSGKTLALDFTSTESNEARLVFKGAAYIKSLNISSGTNNTLEINGTGLTINEAITINSNKALNVDLINGKFGVGENQTSIKNSAKMTFNFISGFSGINGAGINIENNGTLDLNVGSENTSGAVSFIKKLTKATNGVANLTFNSGNNAFYFDPISADTSTLELTQIKSNGANNIVDIASIQEGTKFNINSTRKDFRVLKVGNGSDCAISGQSLGFKIFVDKDQSGSKTIGGQTINAGTNNYGYAYSDRIIINSQSDTSSTHNLLIIPKIDELSQISYTSGGTEVENNVAVATIKKGSGITLATEKVLNGFEVIQAELIAVDTDENGKAVASTNPNGKTIGDYTTYFLGSIRSEGVTVETQEVASTALSINYDLYMANLNSLNKRMGELRDNSHNQGVWARVFGGAQSSSFGIGSDTEYVTVQAGYDYDFDFSNAKNYLGVAFSYATSTSKSLSATQNIVNANASSNNVAGIDNINSNAYEVAVYNAYVSDSGWYNDTIAKFSYINSTFSLTNSANQSSTTNMAFTLSDEVGYRYKFAENEKGNWYIDPQLELAFGYLNQSDFNSVIASVSSNGFSNLNAFQDAVMTLRTRIGASLGKKFNTDKGFASLYVGAFYEYDYVAGGDSDVGVESGATNTLSPLTSSGRAVLNVGSNIELTKGARLYIDVEKSFGDKFRTHMQFNVGTRYSF